VTHRILVIKLSALGDVILSVASFQAIRAHHADAHITLLTTAPFVELAEALGVFDEIWADSRPRPWQVDAWLRLARRLRGGRFERVYDLQGSQRTGWYFRLAGRPEWAGRVAGCAFRYLAPPGKLVHAVEREAALLAMAGVAPPRAPDLSALNAPLARFALPARFALLVPGCARHRPGKRWPVARYADLATALLADELTPVLIGAEAERAEIDLITERCPEARDLGGRTDLFDLAALARRARVAVGNDTGPIHLIAAAGCPTVVLYSAESNPVTSRPPWPEVRVLQCPKLADLPVATVLDATRGLIGAAASCEAVSESPISNDQ